MEKFTQWYFIAGIITCLIGGFRSMKGKQSIDCTELDALLWIFFWWLYLPPLVFSLIYNKITKNDNN